MFTKLEKISQGYNSLKKRQNISKCYNLWKISEKMLYKKVWELLRYPKCCWQTEKKTHIIVKPICTFLHSAQNVIL